MQEGQGNEELSVELLELRDQVAGAVLVLDRMIETIGE